MKRNQFKVLVKDQEGKKHKFTYTADSEEEVKRRVKNIIPNCSILSILPEPA